MYAIKAGDLSVNAIADFGAIKFARTSYIYVVSALLCLFCNCAEATLYSCADNSGAKVLQSTPCVASQKQSVVEIPVNTESWSKVDSNGGVQLYPQHDQQSNGYGHESKGKSAVSDEERCEDTYRKATETGFGAGGKKVSAQLWMRMNCKGHCDELYSIQGDQGNGTTSRDIAATMLSVCK